MSCAAPGRRNGQPIARFLTLGEHDADVLGISVTMLFNISMACELVREARLQRPALSVIVGGAAFRAAPDLWREVDADSRADDVRTAVAAMRETS